MVFKEICFSMEYDVMEKYGNKCTIEINGGRITIDGMVWCGMVCNGKHILGGLGWTTIPEWVLMGM